MPRSPGNCRRSFLRAAFAGGLAGWAGKSLARPAATDAHAAGEPDWVGEARAEIPGLRGGLYFQTGAFGLSPQRVMDRTRELLEFQNLSPAHPRQTGRLREIDASCRALVAETVGAKPTEVALTANTTTGINIVLGSIDWRAGDEIIISDEEHPALLLPSSNLARRHGVVRRTVALEPSGELVDRVRLLLGPRTRLVALSHVARGTGRIVPVADLASELRSRGVPLLVDGAQGPGNVPVNFAALGCDYYSLCGHKWLLGPKGTGALVVREDRLESTPVDWTGANAQASMDEDGGFAWHPDARRFEFATRFQAGFGGWAESLAWLKSLGWPRIHGRVLELSGHAVRQIQASRRLRLASPAAEAERNGIVVVRLPEGFTASACYDRLREEDGMLVSPAGRPRDLRVCLHFYNTRLEFDRLLERLEQHAAG